MTLKKQTGFLESSGHKAEKVHESLRRQPEEEGILDPSNLFELTRTIRGKIEEKGELTVIFNELTSN